MATTYLKENFGLDDEENDIWSVYNCIFCNARPNGNSKILECLHIACNNCILEKTIESSVQCLCQTVTKGQLTECTVIPKINEKIQSCYVNDCCKKPVRICVQCEKHYCRKCAKEHLKSSNNHNPSVMKIYPMEIQLTLCSFCKKKCAEVYCTKCSVIVCALCHLSLHQEHDYEDLEKYVVQIKTNLNKTFFELKKNYEYVSFRSDQNIKQIENLEIIKKNLIEQEIDREINKLRKEVNERAMLLKSLLENNFLDSLTKINKNAQNIQNLREKNHYNLNLIEALLKYNDTSYIIKLSETVLDKLKCTSRQILLDEHTPSVEDIKVSFDGTFEKCVSAIEAVKWNIIFEQNSSEIDNVESSNNDDLTVNVQSDNLNNKTGSEIASQLLVECICCKKKNETLIKCNYCDRHFHNNCHVPALLENVELPKNWKCTMCQNITNYSDKMLNSEEQNVTNDAPLNKFELKIMERILLELYCHNICDNQIRQCFNKGIYPEFYCNVMRCTSLDDVKRRFESKQYTLLFNFLKDIKQIFVDALLYYPSSDPHYLAAFDLQTTFNSVIIKWIPKFDLAKLPQM